MDKKNATNGKSPTTPRINQRNLLTRRIIGPTVLAFIQQIQLTFRLD